MTSIPTFETDRLILRSFSLNDAKRVQDLAGAREIAATTLNVPHPYEDGMAEDWISGHDETFSSGKGVVLSITVKETGELVGAVSLMNIVAGHQGELGYWVGVPYWNRGYCTEAAKELMRYGFEDRGLNRIHACYLSRNPASGRVMQKLGMRYEGKRIQHVSKWGEFDDMELMGILKSEWQKAA